ncbi:hypothetical protein WJX84_004623 [Apatococcus fuscideae]|uniref:Uncharacterized protein n=1 Tax=Apatococcus fuscideae TaxID=2026836 RepID=A0AAW1RIQ4_9CHLO
MAVAATTSALLTRPAPVSCRRPAPLGALPGLSKCSTLRSQPTSSRSQHCRQMTAAPVRGSLQVAHAMEVTQLANEGAFIGGTAAVTFAITLVVRPDWTV